MVGMKTYKKPKGDIFTAIYDIIELQHGTLILSDTKLGRLQYSVTMYDFVWELLYNITEIISGKSEVSLRCTGERNDKKREIRRQFALLDIILEGGADVRIVERG